MLRQLPETWFLSKIPGVIAISSLVQQTIISVSCCLHRAKSQIKFDFALV